MRSTQELLFFLAGWVEMGQFVYLMFSFLSPKEHNFQKTKISQKDRKKNLIYLNSHRYYVIYCLYFPNTSKLK